MVAFLLGLILFCGIAIGSMSFIVWAFREHVLAEKYRELTRKALILHQSGLAQPPAKEDGWKITWRTGRKNESVVVRAATEGLAVKDFIKKQQTGYDSIVSVEKC